jgi:DNA replication protein DnaC
MKNSEKNLVLNFEKLGFSIISSALIEAFTSPQMQHTPIDEVLLEATNEELEYRKGSRANRLLKMAKLQNSVANIDQIEYSPQRNLDKLTVDRLATCEYIKSHSNVIVIGAAGTGKTFIAKALAYSACEEGFRSKVVSYSSLMRELAHHYKTNPLKYEKRLRYYSRFPLLLIDDWLCQAPEKQWVNILLELMECRYDESSTIICTQLPIENWPPVIGNIALAEAILSRITAASFVLRLQGPNLRDRYHTKP